MPIDCPAAFQSVKAHPGPPLTICVYGSLNDNLAASPSGARGPGGAPIAVMVQTVPGHTNVIPAVPPAGSVAAAIVGQDWCASKVPVSSAADTLPGDPHTVFGWQLDNFGNVSDSWLVKFYTVKLTVAGGVDCCEDCVGSGSDEPMEGEVAAVQNLELTVSEGADKGLHPLTRLNARSWSGMVGKTTLTIRRGRRHWILRDDKTTFAAKSVSQNPFSAVFPGTPLGVQSDLLVTVK